VFSSTTAATTARHPHSYTYTLLLLLLSLLLLLLLLLLLQADGADYVGVGAVFPTGTKASSVIGLAASTFKPHMLNTSILLLLPPPLLLRPLLLMLLLLL
jgi:hypothetical protein